MIQYNAVPLQPLKANRKQIAVKLADFDIIMIIYIKQSLSVSDPLCYMIKSLNWDLRIRVIHDIIACYCEL